MFRRAEDYLWHLSRSMFVLIIGSKRQHQFKLGAEALRLLDDQRRYDSDLLRLGTQILHPPDHRREAAALRQRSAELRDRRADIMRRNMGVE